MEARLRSGKPIGAPKFRFDSLRISLLFVRSGPEAELKGNSDIGLGACGKQRDQPALVLDIPRKTKARSGEDVCIDRDIILAPALRNITGIEYAVPKFYADFSAWREPIIRADLFPLCRPSNPGSDQPSVIVVAAVVLTVVVDANPAERDGVCISSLHPEIQVRDSRNLGQVEPSL